MSFTEKIKGTIKKTGFLKIILSAVLFALPFTVGEVWIFSWIGLVVPFLYIFDTEKTLKRVLCSLFCFFFVFYLCLYSWFAQMYPLDFVGFGNAQSVGIIVAALVIIPTFHTAIMTLCVGVSAVLSRKYKSVTVKILALCCGYCLGEFLQSTGTFAFPWGRLFVSQTENIFSLQSASLFGSYFVTFVIVAVNGLLAYSLKNLDNRKKAAIFALLAVGVFGVNLAFGCIRIAAYKSDKQITLTALQGNIPSGEKWSLTSSDMAEVYYDVAKEASEEAEKNGVKIDLAVMPETSIPRKLEGNINVNNVDSGWLNDSLYEMSKTLDSTLAVGAFDFQDDKEYNALFYYETNGDISQPYHKKSLVPFGEFLPYRDLLSKLVPALEDINMLSSDLTPGSGYEPVTTKAGKVASLVCFDSVFPENARKQVKHEADVIAVSTNDSWYKTSPALKQHAAHSVMRAVENNRPLVRSANTGISMIVSPLGIVQKELCVNERGSITDTVEYNGKTTLYTLTGDVLLYACAGYLLVIAVMCLVKKLVQKGCK